MQETSLKHLIYWGLGGAAAGALPLLLIYASYALENALSSAVFIAPFVVVWGLAAGMLTHYTWNTGARAVACLLGVAASPLSLIELLVGSFFGPAGLSGSFLALLGMPYPSMLELVSGVIIAGLLYQAALLVVLLVARQLFRWANTLAARYRRSR